MKIFVSSWQRPSGQNVLQLSFMNSCVMLINLVSVVLIFIFTCAVTGLFTTFHQLLHLSAPHPGTQSPLKGQTSFKLTASWERKMRIYFGLCLRAQRACILTHTSLELNLSVEATSTPHCKAATAAQHEKRHSFSVVTVFASMRSYIMNTTSRLSMTISIVPCMLSVWLFILMPCIYTHTNWLQVSMQCVMQACTWWWW